MRHIKAASIALTAIIAATPAAAEDAFYKCSDGSSMVYSGEARSMTVTRDGHAAVEIPFHSTIARYALWTHDPNMDANDCANAQLPCALQWSPARGAEVVYYELERGLKISCAEVRN